MWLSFVVSLTRSFDLCVSLVFPNNGSRNVVTPFLRWIPVNQVLHLRWYYESLRHPMATA